MFSPASVDAAGITLCTTAQVTPSSACQIGSTQNDFLNPLQVNADGLFGFSDWKFGEKELEASEQAVNLGFHVSGGLLSGTWSINDVWKSLGITHLMIVLKGGTDNFAAYLIDFGATSGTYSTAFFNPKNGNGKDISHISVYYRTGMRVVPEPQLLVLFGLGLFFVSRRLSALRRLS
jgi:hypothetical protein